MILLYNDLKLILITHLRILLMMKLKLWLGNIYIYTYIKLSDIRDWPGYFWICNYLRFVRVGKKAGIFK